MNEKTQLTDHGNKIIFETEDSVDVQQLVSHLKRRNWDQVKAKGDLETLKALWLYGTVEGLSISGYSPSLKEREAADRLRMAKLKKIGGPQKIPADIIVADYNKRVIPGLQKELSVMRNTKLRTSLKDRAIEPKLEKESEIKRLKISKDIEKAREQRDYFLRFGKSDVLVERATIGRTSVYISPEREKELSRANTDLDRAPWE